MKTVIFFIKLRSKELLLLFILIPVISSAQIMEEWVARYNGTGNSTDNVYSFKLDAVGNIYVTGQSIGIGTDYDYATVKYNSSGTRYHRYGYRKRNCLRSRQRRLIFYL